MPVMSLMGPQANRLIRINQTPIRSRTRAIHWQLVVASLAHDGPLGSIAVPLDEQSSSTSERGPTCHRCGHCLRGQRVDSDCPECGLPIAASFQRRPSCASTIGLLTAAMTLPISWTLVFFSSDPRWLWGVGYKLVFFIVGPSALLSIVLALICAGVRLSKWAVAVLLVALGLTVALAYWGLQAAAWGV